MFPTRRRLMVQAGALALAGCAPQGQAQESPAMFSWLPTECAPQAYPMHLLAGTLGLPDGSTVAVPARRDVANGWGQRGSTHIVGPASKPLPQRLELEWFSYTEDKFWRGSFNLPLPLMTSLFQAGVAEDRTTHKPQAWERIIVGMAPAGLVAVWLAAGAEVVEVAAYQAQPADLPWSRVLNNPDVPRDAFIRKVLSTRLGADGLERLARVGIPPNLYAGYRQMYRWRPWVTGAGRPLGTTVRSHNGENAWIGPAGPAVRRETRAVPAQVELQWAPPQGATLSGRVDLDEAETFAAFAKLARGDANRQLALHLETTQDALAVTLRDEKFVLPLEKARVVVTRAR